MACENIDMTCEDTGSVGVASAVCVLGLGLIGGSLLRDLQRAERRVFGWNRSAETVKEARTQGYDVSAELVEVLQRAERERALIVLGVPVPALGFLFEQIVTHAPSCGITDVTSVKAEVVALAREHGVAERFVGGHPMAGTAHSGWSATTHGLFQGAVWVVTEDRPGVEDPAGAGSESESDALTVSDAGAGADSSAETDADSDAGALWRRTWHEVVDMAQCVGARVVHTWAREHDRAVARISHAPHIVAEAVALSGAAGGDVALTLAASSFRDITRVAGTDPGLVQAMCENNRESVVEALSEIIEELIAARDSLSTGGTIQELTERGFHARQHWSEVQARTPDMCPYPTFFEKTPDFFIKNPATTRMTI